MSSALHPEAPAAVSPATFHNACGVHSSTPAYGRGSGWCPIHSLPVYKDGQDWLTDMPAAQVAAEAAQGVPGAVSP